MPLHFPTFDSWSAAAKASNNFDTQEAAQEADAFVGTMKTLKVIGGVGIGIAVALAILGVLGVSMHFIPGSANLPSWLAKVQHALKPLGLYSFAPLAGGIILTALLILAIRGATKKQAEALKEKLDIATKATTLSELAQKSQEISTALTTSPLRTTLKEGENPISNCDFAGRSRDGKFGFVLDGQGHDHPKLAACLNEVLTEYLVEQQDEPIPDSFENEASAIEWANTKLERLLALFKAKKDQTIEGEKQHEEAFEKASHSATFTWIIKIDNKRHAICGQFGDTTLVKRNADGTIDWVEQQFRTASSNPNLKLNRFNLRTTTTDLKENHIFSFPFEEGSSLFVFSDGIGDKFTREEITPFIQSAHSAEEFLTSTVAHIRGDFRKEVKDRVKGKPRGEALALNTDQQTYFVSKEDEDRVLEEKFIKDPNADCPAGEKNHFIYAHQDDASAVMLQ